MSTTRSQLLRKARVKAGHVKFRCHQFLASNTVPAYRRLRSIDTPLAERSLFVLAHPRSGSTVLSHVLQSHDAVIGFGEHHESYEDESDLAALAARNAFFARQPDTPHIYTLDKIVWNHHHISDAVLGRDDTRFVFLVREPVATLESYRRMFHDMPTDERRLLSYRTRLAGLCDLAKRIDDPERMAFVTYDGLTDATEDTLSHLTDWLDLDTPLTPEYALNAKSGSQSWGDPSPNIKAGAIIRVPRETPDITLEVIDAAHAIYRTTCEELAALTTAHPLRSAEQPPLREVR